MHELTEARVMALLTSPDAAVDLRSAINRIAGSRCRLTGVERLSASTFRLRMTRGAMPTIVVKRMTPQAVALNEAVRLEWLPALGLGEHGPPLLDIASNGRHGEAWCVYADAGNDLRHAGWSHLGPLVDLVAELHLRAYGHPLVEEVVAFTGDRGAAYLSSRLEGAMDGLNRVLAESGHQHRPVLSKLAAELEAINIPARTDAITGLGGPPTLLHGDLWPMNVLVHDGAIRLIDWERAAGGPAAFDLSILIRRFPAALRAAALDRYLKRNPIFPSGHSVAEVESLFESFEMARIVDDVAWQTATIVNDPASTWALDDLERTYEWLMALGPVFESRP